LEGQLGIGIPFSHCEQGEAIPVFISFSHSGESRNPATLLFNLVGALLAAPSFYYDIFRVSPSAYLID